MFRRLSAKGYEGIHGDNRGEQGSAFQVNNTTIHDHLDQPPDTVYHNKVLQIFTISGNLDYHCSLYFR